MSAMEQNLADRVQFDANGLIAVAITDCESLRLLVLCYMNPEALERTMREGRVYVYRRSKGRIALKGEVSGHVQEVREIRVNCDANSLEIRVHQHVAACAKGYYSCYYRRWDPVAGAWIVDGEPLFDPEQTYN